jgi:uncharacterized protein YndB with AHSA1/START domain
MDATATRTLKITTPSDLEFAMSREFDAPRRLVFEAMTTPEHVRRWLGSAEHPITTCEIDLRVGGGYRYVFRRPDGSEMILLGTFTEVTRPDRVAFVERMIMPGFSSDEYRVTSTFAENDGKTTLTTTVRHNSKENRDGHLYSGVEKGVEPAYDRIAELVATMV